MMENDLERIKEKIREFDSKRDWKKFHNPKDLLVALVSEVGELAECYRWLDLAEIEKIHEDSEKRKKVESELADILMFLIRLADNTNIDIVKAFDEKIKKLDLRYPSDTVKGVHTNPIEGYKSREGI